MPTQATIPLIMGVIIFIIIIVTVVISIKNVNQHLKHSIDGHLVEIVTHNTYMQLIIDNNIVDEIRSYAMNSVKLQGSIDDKNIIVNIGTGFLCLKITTFFVGKKVLELSNC